MKVGIYSDIHLSRNDVEINESNAHNIFESILWARKVFKDKGCELVINNGDFLDSETIDSETNYIITNVFKDNSQKEILLCGNHEIKDKDAKYNSLNILSNYPNIDLYNKLSTIEIDKDTTFIFQPYTNKEEDIKALCDKLDSIKTKHKILFSHLTYVNVPNVFLNDKIKGEISYTVVKDRIDLIFNGHIHTALESEKYCQIGSLCGLSFSDDYKFHNPGIIIFDTDTMKWERIENPVSVLYKKTMFDNLPTEDLSRTYLRVDCPVSLIEKVEKELIDLKLYKYKLKLILENTEVIEQKQNINLYSNPLIALKDFIKTEKGVYTEEELNTFLDKYYSNQKLIQKESD